MDTSKAPQPISLRALIGTIVFTLVVPGTFVVLIPYLLSGWQIEPPFFGLSITRWLGAAMVVAALPYFFGFLRRFVVEGRGTPAPIAPPERLVTGGSFERVRNPGYIGVIAMLTGQGLFFGAERVLLYAVIVAAVFHLFVILYEEPTLRRQFGSGYEEYCRRVPRWIPRFR